MSIDKRLISTGSAAGVCTTDTLDIFGDSSCVALYGLNYDGSDASGNYDGTPTSVDFNAPGYIDYAASFNGSSSYIETPLTYNTIVDVNDKTKDFSFSLWMYQRSQSTSTANVFVINEYSPSFQYVGLNISSSGNLQWVQYPGGASGVNANTPTALNQWIHVACVRENSSLKIYKNGTLEDTVAHTISNNTLDSTIKWVFGARLDGGNDLYFDGKIDQVRIFNKALSSSEVTTLYGEVACEYTCTTDTNGFPASASSDLVAYYKLDNDATDETGSYNGTASNVTFDGGRYGSAAVFNGSSSVIQASGLNQFFNNWNDASWSAWINTTDTSSQFIVSTSTNEQNYKLLGDTFSNKFKVVVRKSSTVYVGESTTDINDGNWHHIAASYDNSTGAVKGYVDGSEEISFTTGGSSSGTFSVFDFCIGANKQGSTVYNPLDGKIDQVRIYDKALSSTEVSSLYEDEHQCYITVDSTDPFGDSSNLALYEFENNANDSNGSYNGTASNVTYSTDSIIGTYAADFNGSSSYINTGLTKSNWVSDLNSRNVDFSISLWANVDAVVGGDNTFLYIGNYNVYSPLYAAMIIDYRSSGSKIRFTHQSTYVESTSTISLDTWYHIVCVRESGVIKLYINGVLESFATPSADMQISSSAVATLGALYFSSTTHGELDGMLDQVRIFNTALDGDKVWKLYAEGAKG